MKKSAADTMPAEPVTRVPDELRRVAIADIDPNAWNPRHHVDLDAQEALNASVGEKGLLQPVLLRRRPGGRLEVVAGMRRFRAAISVGLLEIPALVKDLTDHEALEESVSENIQRQDMHVVDEARAYAALQTADKRLHTVGKIAARFGQTESHVYRRLKLLDLEKPLLEALEEDRLSIGHAERLCRLTPALRKLAAHPEHGVVWRRNPLLEYGQKWEPAREDLRPLNELEDFIRTKSRFDPTSPDARAFQPELAEQLDGLVQEETEQLAVGESSEIPGEVLAFLVELSDDPLARTRLNAGKTEQIPLTPSRWREITKPSDRCDFAVRGVITHGKTAGRVLEVCTAKTKCTKHFPPAKKSTSRMPRTDAHASERRLAAERKAEEKRQADQAAWDALRPHAVTAFVAHVAGLKLTAGIVRECVQSWQITETEETFGVKLTDKTAVQFLILASVVDDLTGTGGRERFLAAVKPWKFNLGPVEQRVKADAKKVTLKPTKAPKKKNGKKAAA